MHTEFIDQVDQGKQDGFYNMKLWEVTTLLIIIIKIKKNFNIVSFRVIQLGDSCAKRGGRSID